jgi:hypothetical protein
LAAAVELVEQIAESAANLTASGSAAEQAPEETTEPASLRGLAAGTRRDARGGVATRGWRDAGVVVAGARDAAQQFAELVAILVSRYGQQAEQCEHAR